MKRLSSWAKKHKQPARIIIIVSSVLLIASGIVTGILLNSAGIFLSSALLPAFIILYFITAVAYPSQLLKRRKNAIRFYTRQKSCDLLLAASAFCMIVCCSNQPGKMFNYTATLHAANPAPLPKDSVAAHKTIAAFSASLKDETGKSLTWKQKKQLLKVQIKAVKKAAELSNGAKTALIILSVIAALGLLALVGSLSCNLSCSGSAGASVLVAIGGTGLTIFLLVLAIRAIMGRKKKPKNSGAGKAALPGSD